MASNAKVRPPRLRASCDGCFLAKVKCSKARPICSRCLACGIECRYSPSSRAGKPKSDHSAHHRNGSPHGELADLSPLPDSKEMVFTTHPSAGGLYKLETEWQTPGSLLDGTVNRNPSISSGLAMLGMDERAARDHDASVGMYGVSMAWTPPSDLSAAPYNESPMAAQQLPLHHGRSASMDVAMSTHMAPAWLDAGHAHGMLPYSQHNSIPTQANLGSHYFPSPSATPTLRPTPPRHKASPASPVGGSNSCTCFTVCLQSLQALHNASAPAMPPFDMVLSLNRKAVEGCAAMLACPKCMNRSGTHTAAMLLATVMGKITSFYKNASQTYFESGRTGPTAASPQHGSPGTGLGVSLGAYTLGGEDGRWFELEILNRELRKLEELHAQFREVCGELSEDPEVSRAMIGYLGQTLGSTLDVVNHRKGNMGYV